MNFVTPQHDLTECDHETIHQIRAIQPLGGLIKLNSDWSIDHRSLNCAQVLGLPHLPELGSNLAEIFQPSAIEALTAALASRSSQTQVERVFGLQLTDDPRRFDCAVHTAGERIIVEFEPHDADEFVNPVSLITPGLGAAALSQTYGRTRLASRCPTTSRCPTACAFAAACAFAERATGALFITLSRAPDGHLIVWRKPLSKKARRASDRTKTKTAGHSEGLQPRDSFAAGEQPGKEVRKLTASSAKYGSVCDPSRRVCADLSHRPNGDLATARPERGSPPVQTPTRRGFGSAMIGRPLPFKQKGQANLRFTLIGPEGDFVIPRRYMTRGNSQTSGPQGGAGVEDPGNDNGADLLFEKPRTSGLPDHTLIVEDSMIIALDIEENLRRSGVTSIDVTNSVVGALCAIRARAPAFAIVDFNLGNESSEPVLEELNRRGVPFVMATGYSELGDKLDQIGAMALVRKPYGRAEIEEVLTQFMILQASDPASDPASGPGLSL